MVERTLVIPGASEEDRELAVSAYNLSGLDDKTVYGRLPIHEIASALRKWTQDQLPAPAGSGGSLFSRSTFLASDNIYDQLLTARDAMRDDVVAGVADVTEGLAFQKLGWESEEPDEADVFNQISRDVNLDEVVRQMWRELFTHSQVIVASWWGSATYTVRGATDKGNKRKRTFQVACPRALTVLDSTKVVPVGSLFFGQEGLAWQATAEETELVRSFRLGPDGPVAETPDPLLDRLILGPYVPRGQERRELESLGIDVENLLLLDPRYVWRHTLTRPSYQRWADVRLASVFRLLDLKRQMMDADRVTLVGAANYILLVRKGDKDKPAVPEEIDNLKEQVNLVAKLPVIIGDHRLSIEIITPKLDTTLSSQRYAIIDSRLVMRCMGTFHIGTGQPISSADNVQSTTRVVARGIENRRWMLKRALEARIARTVVAQNPGVFETEPNLFFRPRNVQIDLDAPTVEAILQLRTLGELSRETTLEEFGFEQDVEAQRRTLEKRLDPIFKTAVPFSSPQTNPFNDGDPGGRAGPDEGDSTATDRNGRPGTSDRKAGRPRVNSRPKAAAAEEAAQTEQQQSE